MDAEQQKKLTDLLAQFRNTVYMIFDGACRDGFLAHFQSLDAQSAYTSLFAHTQYRVVAEAPHLIQLKAQSKFLQWALENAGKQAQFILLFSLENFAEMHRHYRNLTHVTLPDARKVCFRFCDPSILCPFLEACSESEKNTWMGPAQYILAAQHGRYEVQRYEVQTNPDAWSAKKRAGNAITDAPHYWWRMEAHHMAAFKQHTEKTLTNNIRYALWRDYPGIMAQYPPADIDPMLRHSITKARHNGVTDEQGLTRYVLLMITINPQFDEHPAVHQYLNQSSATPSQKIDRVMEELSEETWQEICSVNIVDVWRQIVAV